MAPWSFAPEEAWTIWEPKEPEFTKTRKVQSDILEAKRPQDGSTVGLVDLFNLALCNSPETARTWALAQEAASAYGISRADYYPKFDVNANWLNYSNGFALTDNSVFIQQQSQGGPLLELSYTFWDFGERVMKSREYMYALGYANWTHNQEVQAVLQSVASAYYNYLYQKALLTAARQNLDDAWRSLDSAKTKMDLGITDVADFLQAKTTYLQRKVDLSNQTGALQNARIELLKQIGLTEDSCFELGDFPVDPPTTQLKQTACELRALAEKNRPDILAAKANYLSKEAAFEKQKSAALPKVTGSAEGGYTWFSSTAYPIRQYALEFQVSFPLFAGFYYENQVKRAKAEMKEACALLKAKELEASSQVMQAASNFDVAIENVPLSTDYRNVATKNLDSTLAHYKNNTATILDLLNAQGQLASARAQYAGAIKELFTSIIDLSFATGTLYFEKEASFTDLKNRDVTECPEPLIEEVGIYSGENSTSSPSIPQELKTKENIDAKELES